VLDLPFKLIVDTGTGTRREFWLGEGDVEVYRLRGKGCGESFEGEMTIV